MTEQDRRLAERALELRQAFDLSFAHAPRGEPAAFAEFLAIRLGTDSYAIRLNDVSGLFAGKPVTRLPSSVSGFLGIAAFRGALVPVYDLRVLLGYSAGDIPRWLVTVAEASVALAFDAFDEYLRLPLAAIAPEQRPDPSRRHIREAVRVAELVRPIVDIASVLEAIRKQAQ